MAFHTARYRRRTKLPRYLSARRFPAAYRALAAFSGAAPRKHLLYSWRQTSPPTGATAQLIVDCAFSGRHASSRACAQREHTSRMARRARCREVVPKMTMVSTRRHRRFHDTLAAHFGHCREMASSPHIGATQAVRAMPVIRQR